MTEQGDWRRSVPTIKIDPRTVNLHPEGYPISRSPKAYKREMTASEQAVEVNWQHKIAPKRRIIYPKNCPLFAHVTLQQHEETENIRKTSARSASSEPPIHTTTKLSSQTAIERTQNSARRYNRKRSNSNSNKSSARKPINQSNSIAPSEQTQNNTTTMSSDIPSPGVPMLKQVWVTEVANPTPSERIALNYSQPLGHASPRLMNLQKKKANPPPTVTTKDRPASSLGFGHLLPKEDKVRPFRPVSASPRADGIFDESDSDEDVDDDEDEDEDEIDIGNLQFNSAILENKNKNKNNKNKKKKRLLKSPVLDPTSTLLPHYAEPAPLYDRDFIFIDESKLPVYYYDHQEYESKTPEEWLSNGPITGKSPMYENGAYIWAPCNILKYDKEKTKYLIQFVYTGKEKWVRRLNLMMDEENAEDFWKRRIASYNDREMAKCGIRLALHTENQPSDDIHVAPMQQEWQESILSKILTFSDPIVYMQKNKRKLETVLTEIRNHYMQGVKRGILEYKLLSENERQKFIHLRIPIPPREPPAPFYGEITDIPEERGDYQLYKENIRGLHYTKYRPISILLLWINTIWDTDYADKIMLDAFDREVKDIELKFNIPCLLSNFENHQKKHSRKMRDILLNDWRTILLQYVSDDFQGIYDMLIKSIEEYEVSPMKQELTHIQYNIGDQLRLMGVNTVDRYIKMIEDYCEKDEKKAKIYEQYFIDRTPEMNGLPNFIPTEVGDTREPNIQYTAIPPLPHVPPVIYTHPALFKVSLVVDVNEGICRLDPSAEDIENTIIGCLTDAINYFGDIYKIDQMILTLITLPLEPLVDFKTKDEKNPTLSSILYIEKRIEEVRNYIRQSLKAPLALAELYTSVAQYITLDPYEEMKRIGVRPCDRIDPELEGQVEQTDPLDYPPQPEDYLEERETLRLYKRIIDVVRYLSNDIEYFSLVQVDCRMAKDVIETTSNTIYRTIIGGIEEDQSEIVDRINKKYKSISEKVRQIPETEDELSALQTYIKGIEDIIKKMEENVSVMFIRIESLEEFRYIPVQDDFEKMWLTLTWPSDIRDAVNISYGQLGMQKMAMIENLDKEKDAFRKELTQLISDVKAFLTVTDIEKHEEYSREAMSLQDRIDEAHYKINNFNHREEVFDLQKTEYNDINGLQVEFKPYYDLWTTLSEAVSMIERYLTDDFSQLDVDEIETNIMDWWKMALSLSKVFANQEGPMSAVDHMKESITEFRKKLPLIQALTSKGLQERHWNDISNKVGFALNPDEGLNIECLLDEGIIDHLEEIQSIVAVASKEWALEKALNDMEAEWTKIAYEIAPYRETGTFVVRSTDDISALLDDQLVKTQTMRGSPFIGPIEGAVKDWEAKILYTQKLLESWMWCQRTWIYLEPIFSSEDIMNQMPKEARKFAGVDSMWRKTMSSIRRSPMVMEVSSREGFISQFERANSVLEEIQAKLNEYLERKRKAFPRFFFLSNDELIEILAQTKDPRAVQPHLNKSFEGIHHVTFTEDYCITHIQSAEKEEIELLSPVDPNEGRKKGNVELWMTELEEKMIAAMEDLYIRSLNAYLLTKRTRWVFDWPGQIVLAVDCTIWTQEVEQAIISEEENALVEYEKRLTNQLNEIVELVRGDLTFLQRQTLGALTVIDVHARDVVSSLAEKKVYELDDFNWMAQLRYYFEREDEQLVVKIVNAETDYMYEYIGNSTRLVITPLTDRCYRTLMGAVYLIYGGAPEGPAGTGKTESVKDLSKAVATQCVVFNCSDGLDYLAMAKFFKGLAASGAWSCFDEFNRIDLEVLSVIAQQILTIQKAKQEQVTNFIFEGTSIPLKASCNVFITMNPGYAGRSELPDNLKSLFRPCAMMVPDYALIAEITLYSYGFTEARLMARKLVRVLRLCSEQLSSQDHYDYGMRAVKAILLAAGNLRRKEPNERQDILTLRAITDVNLPKFTSNDIPLFQGITSDLFPNVQLPKIDYGPLVKSMKDYCQQHKLVSHDNFIRKCLQLYDTTIVRHGLMLVGGAGAGKTCVINCLSAGMSVLKDMSDYENVKVVTINPKCITQDQLYGKFDENSHEWQDGVLAVQVRVCAKDTTPDKKWIVFDGPVDAVWIENMNTVLDDNKKLCLNSGEIIRLTPQMTIMFEVENLIVASPATVSRCGMVFMEPKQLGYEALIESWKMTLPEGIKFMETFIFTLIDELIPPCLSFVMKRLTKPLPVTEMELTTAFLRLVTTQLDEVFKENCETLPSSHELMSYFESIFVFCTIWSIGICTDEHGRELFNEFLRSHLSPAKVSTDVDDKPEVEIAKRQALKNLRPIPRDGSVYDYYFDKESKKWVKWTLINENRYEIPDNIEYSSIYVPTMDNIQISMITDALLFHGYHTLVVGATGTGKSVTFMKKLYEELPRDKWSHTILDLTATTTGNQVQTMIENKLIKRRKGLYGPTPGKTMIWFIDDMNLPIPESSGCQPPIELLRQWSDHGGWYEIHEQPTYFKNIQNVQMLVAMGTPGGGKYPVTMRLLRHFSIMNVVPFNEETMRTIFSTIVAWFLRPFPNSVRSLNKELVDSSIEIFQIISTELLPTPGKLHYTFNLRDLSKVFQGLSQGSKTRITEQVQMARMWSHECLRIFSDRLVDETDRQWFMKNLKDLLYKYYHMTWDKVKGDQNRIIFGDYIPSHQGDYAEIENHEEMKQIIQQQMDEYNTISSSPLELVLFDMAIDHMNRVARCIRHPQGNALLVGVGGSGRKSISRLASYMQQYRTYEVEVSRSYTVQSWKDDLKKVIKIAGAENKSICFIFCDTQIMYPSFMEDINALLNTGEVPNLYEPDELSQILEAVGPAAVRAGKGGNNIDMYNFFVETTRKNLHIILCFSPIGNAYKSNLRQFPSIVNCCYIDWFSEWPREALETVGEFELKKMKFNDTLRKNILDICVDMQERVQGLCKRYLSEHHQHYYVTPMSYLGLMKTFSTIYLKRKNEMMKTQTGYAQGLQKLLETESKVESMKEELKNLQPTLEVAKEEVAKLMEDISVKQVSADAQRQVVEKESEECDKQARDAQAIRDSCEADLSQALPILHAAENALKKLSKADLVEVKSMTNPPKEVKVVMEVMCVFLKEKLQGTYWETAKKKILNDTKLIDKLLGYNKEKMDEKLINKILPYLDVAEFSEARVQNASKAAYGMCKWIRAMVKYFYVEKSIKPKREALKESEQKLSVLKAALAQKQSELQQVVDHLNQLKASFDDANSRKETLEQQVEDCKTRLTRAEKLILALSDEKLRWADKVSELGSLSENVIGDSLLGSGIVSYLGFFLKSYREECIKSWKDQLNEANIITTPDFSLRKCFGEAIQIRSWTIHHLPSDDYSVTNALILQNSLRYPLMIDPQGQASRWIKSNENERGLKVVRQNASDFVRTLQNCVQFGKPVLIDNVAEDLDAVLDPLLLKQMVRIGGVDMIKVGDSQFKMDDNFQLYMITKLRAPHYPPETCVKVNLLNFMATEDGLSDQMLGIVVKKERSELEERRERCLLERSENQKELKRIEAKILEMISSAEGNILDDESLIEALSESKITSNDVQERETQAERTENMITSTREKYQAVSERASLLFFCISDLAGIDNMYQYSLEWFVGLFNRAIEIAPKSDKIDERSQFLINSFTYLIYTNVCRSLFGVHHLLFSFLMCTKIMTSQNLIHATEYRYFLTGNTAMEIHQSNPCVDEETGKKWLSDEVWKDLFGLHDIESFTKFIDDIIENPEMIHKVVDSTNPNEDIKEIIEPYEFTSFQQLTIMRFLRLDKLVSFIQSFICDNMEKKYVESPPFDLNAAFNDSTCVTPIIFMLSPGADPMKDFFSLAEQCKYEKKLKTLSLGQGQGPIAESAILEAVDKGTWVVLQNCHLAISWLPTLESLCESITEDRCNPTFRLWLTSKPTEAFPVSILQNGVKITKEAPKGLRSNLIGSYLSYSNKMYDKCPRAKDMHRLLYGLSFFHALVQERRKYGPLGWNISYEFNDSDLRISVAQLELFLSTCKSADDIRYDALLYLTGECNYGGRVTDMWDRRTLNCILEDFYNPNVLEDGYLFTEDPTYVIPEYGPITGVVDFIKTLPLNDGPAVFGLHQNADITCTISESKTLINNLLSLQPRTSSSSSSSGNSDGKNEGNNNDNSSGTNNSLLTVVDDLRERIPGTFDVEGVSILYPVKYEQSMNTVLQQELQRYNKLLSKIDSSLEQLKKAIKGLIVMSIDLEELAGSIEKGLVPELWKTVSYPSLKPLGSWIKDLIERIDFFKHWIDEGPASNFWISGFFFTQSFLTGILQNCARAHQIPIDALGFDFKVLTTEEESNITEAPKEGCYIHGLFLEGAKWNSDEMVLDEQDPKELYCVVPTIQLIPKETVNIDMNNHRYTCPVYKTSERRGVLSTTGHSTNFVVEMYLPMKEEHDENHWVKRGTALLTQLNS